jgi:ABC-type Fe3+-siderophore transport system permease subunit
MLSLRKPNLNSFVLGILALSVFCLGVSLAPLFFVTSGIFNIIYFTCSVASMLLVIPAFVIVLITLVKKQQRTVALIGIFISLIIHPILQRYAIESDQAVAERATKLARRLKIKNPQRFDDVITTIGRPSYVTKDHLTYMTSFIWWAPTFDVYLNNNRIYYEVDW